MSFASYVRERVGWYVYALRNPRTKRIFYVGKGKGNRVFQHASDALECPDVRTDKLAEIRAIRRMGLEVEPFIIRHGIPTDLQAYEVEAAVIDALRLTGCPLTGNMAKGHGHAKRGLARASVVASLYKPPRAPAITMPAVLIKIPFYWTPQISSAELYEATRGWWKLSSSRCQAATVAFSVSKGVIRGVYRVGKWRARRRGDRDWKYDARSSYPRWGFDGKEAPNLAHFLNTSVAHHYRRGDRAPVKYLNC